MPENDSTDEKLPQSPLEVLKDTASKITQLEIEAERALKIELNSNEYIKLLREKTQIVADLPVALEQLQKRGIDVPEEVIDWASDLSTLAKESIETNNTWGMQVLLILPPYTKVGDPNDLERLISKLENPQSSEQQ